MRGQDFAVRGQGSGFRFQRSWVKGGVLKVKVAKVGNVEKVGSAGME